MCVNEYPNINPTFEELNHPNYGVFDTGASTIGWIRSELEFGFLLF